MRKKLKVVKIPYTFNGYTIIGYIYTLCYALYVRVRINETQKAKDLFPQMIWKILIHSAPNSVYAKRYHLLKEHYVGIFEYLQVKHLKFKILYKYKSYFQSFFWIIAYFSTACVEYLRFKFKYLYAKLKETVQTRAK